MQSANINMFQYVWIKEITALKLALFSYSVGYLMLALSISNLYFESRHLLLDREESGDKNSFSWKRNSSFLS